ncbi:MAG: hypothetical protein D6806_12285 [Deltaproteobacteria bacterium]|nr:MAG: hypothetical protein D6806_12285 [Deltaproteobacteria bacterium]
MGRRGSATLAAVLAALVLPIPVFAYILPPEFLARKMAAKRRAMKLTRLTVNLSCSADGQTAEKVLRLKVPGMVRLEGGGRLLVCRNNVCFERDSAATRKAAPWKKWLFRFVSERPDAQSYVRWLKHLGVDMKRNTLSRLGGRIAVVLGAKNWERDRPQFWLDKDLFLPLRLMLREGKSLVELTWTDWGSRTGGDWFPGRIEVSIDGKLVESCRTTSVDARTRVPESLFDIEK